MKNKIIKTKTTDRGFIQGEFIDSYKNVCIIRESSAAKDDYIWLGVDKPRITVFQDETMGKYVNTELPKNWMVHSTMHLSRKHVEELLPFLQEFVETGRLYLDKEDELNTQENG